ncbi:MAG: hypothetical protein RLN88_05735 [Ekhidna sp.]|uniref:hypothetical protein n=1 Tax=Ekhidna sp. TaxID=2608089 RepID=UPI0032EFAB04
MKSKEKHVIRGDFFPIPFIMLGGVLILFSSMSQESEYSNYSVWFLISGAFLSTSRFGTVINTKKKIIKPYLSVLFIRLGIAKKYDLLTCFWLSSSRMKDVWQNAAVKSVSAPYNVVYVYLITSEGRQYFLFRQNSKQGVYEKLANHMQQLGIKCLDRNS